MAGRTEKSQRGGGTVPVVIYTRVSSNKQLGRRFESCESQAAICRDYIANRAKEGWFEAGHFTDPAYSGATMRRPGMDALKRYVETGQVRVVVIFKLERVLRSTDEWAPFRAFLNAHDCQLASAMEDISETTALGRLKNNLLVSVSEYDRLNIAEKVRAKMHEQAKRGYWNGGSVPYGYSYDKNTQTLKADPVEAPIVRRIYDEAAKLVSLHDLANALNAEGIRTKARTAKRRDGTVESIGNRLFRSDGLRLLIQNPLYRGVVKYAGSEYQAQHEGLVSPDLWKQAAAATREPKERAPELVVGRDRHHHVLKGLVHCGHCKRTLVPHASGLSNNAGKRYRYYNCGFVLRERQPEACPVGRLPADALESAILGFLGQVSQQPTLVTGILEATRARNKGDKGALKVEAARLDKSLATLERELSRCVDAIVKGGIPALEESLKGRAEKLRTEQNGLVLEREKVRQELAACEATLFDEKRVRHALERVSALLPQLSPGEQKELIGLFVQRIDVNAETTTGKAGNDASAGRVLSFKIKLHLPGLVEGIENREGAADGSRRIAMRGVNFEAQMDFGRAANGEVTILAPFDHMVRVGTRIRRPVQPVEPPAQHSVVRAERWKAMLASGEVQNRVALAKRFGLTPGAVTRILKLADLLPEIRAYLAALNSKQAIRHFGIKEVGPMAALPPDLQRAQFNRLQQGFSPKAA